MRTPAFRPRAALDLESLAVYLGEVLGSPQTARKTCTAIIDAVDRLCVMPTLGRPFFDDALEREGYRWHLVGHYRIFYTYSTEVLTVWRILHTRQDLDGYALIDWEK